MDDKLKESLAVILLLSVIAFIAVTALSCLVGFPLVLFLCGHGFLGGLSIAAETLSILAIMVLYVSSR